MTLRSGFRIAPGERVLIIEDVVTTGGSVGKSPEAVTAAGGETVGFGFIMDRSRQPLDLPGPTKALIEGRRWRSTSRTAARSARPESRSRNRAVDRKRRRRTGGGRVVWPLLRKRIRKNADTAEYHSGTGPQLRRSRWASISAVAGRRDAPSASTRSLSYPGRVTINPEETDTTWQLRDLKFAVPILAAAMDGVVDTKMAVEMSKLGALGVLNLEGVQTRYEEPGGGPRRDSRGRDPTRRRSSCRSSTRRPSRRS